MAITQLLCVLSLLFDPIRHLAHTSKSVHAATRKTLLKVKGFSEVKVEKIKEAIAKLQVSRYTRIPCLTCLALATPEDSG